MKFSNVVTVLLILRQTHYSQASSFLPLLTSNGSPLCAVGNSSYTIQTNDIIGIPCGVPGATKCAFYCTGLNSRITCTGFNYLTSGLCQFFSTTCIHTYSTPGCIYYQITILTPQQSSCKIPTVIQATTKLFITVDNILLNVYINGNEAIFNASKHADNWIQAKVVLLPSLKGTITVRARNAGDKIAGMLVWDSSRTIFSNATWKCANSTGNGWTSASFNDSSWASAVELAPYGSGAWASNVKNAYGSDPTSTSKWIWTPGTIVDSDEAYCSFTFK